VTVNKWEQVPCHTPNVVSRPMSCMPITPAMADLLEACRSWPVSPEVLEQLHSMPEIGSGAGLGLDHAYGWSAAFQRRSSS
jgi:hypothetical protein